MYEECDAEEAVAEAAAAPAGGKKGRPGKRCAARSRAPERALAAMDRASEDVTG
jgi:hypothetical protein